MFFYFFYYRGNLHKIGPCTSNNHYFLFHFIIFKKFSTISFKSAFFFTEILAFLPIFFNLFLLFVVFSILSFISSAEPFFKIYPFTESSIKSKGVLSAGLVITGFEHAIA